ncbi:unnamed protein product [Rotaria magnacalcarata]|uniref:RING-type domain-containing protein n=1 Tax=Rotaria magnacalcarata TaxID=392030 RepID=A0A816VR09_9BILA|nr:unnamed protein product [Rotaria magnacalcarata]
MCMKSLDDVCKLNNTLVVNENSETKPIQSNDESKSLSQATTSSLSKNTSANIATNLCIVCSTSRRMLVFVPCGHFAVCIPCGHGLELCTTCGSNIKALLRIYD